MKNTNLVSQLVLVKVREQIERTEHLLGLIPPDQIGWQPDLPSEGTPKPRRLGELLGHLLDCLAGFCATLYALHSIRLAHFSQLKELRVNHRCGIEEARERIRDYRNHIEEGFALLTDDHLSRRVPTVFVPEGEPVLTLLLSNLEHLINHKYQLFFYLKMMGVPVGTPDLYHWRSK